MQKDFKRVRLYQQPMKAPEIEKEIEIGAERRILFVGENSSYYKYRSQLVGRLVRLIDRANVGGWRCEFVHDDDRRSLNAVAGWSDRKKVYIFDAVKFK